MIQPIVAEAVDRAKTNSPFLRLLIDQYPDFIDLLSNMGVEAALGEIWPDDEFLARRMRVARNRTFLVLALADLSSIWSFERIVLAISDLADAALRLAIDDAITTHVPGAAPRGLVAIALGKHGSRELNYSSDIDPIFIYDPATLPHRPREDVAEAAVRITRRVVDLMQARDGDGFVFRVDLRLRPASEASPIALPIDGAISHYESSALPWERAAFVRARAAAGDFALGQRFLSAIEPFVWRRSLDFGAVSDLRLLTQSIRAEYGKHPLGPGYDVKRGRGGIREVEFYTQIHQLVHGGRDASLRSGAILPALASLSSAGWVDPVLAVQLADAYVALRTVEHRLQLVDDRQTHVIPEDIEACNAVARLHGLNDRSSLLAMLAPHVALIESTYDALEPMPPQRVGPADAAFRRFADADHVKSAIARWRGGGVRAIRTPAALAAFELMLPNLLEALAEAPDPDASFIRLDNVLGRLSSGINLFRLLHAQPALLHILVGILAHAPVLADTLASTPALFDRLVDQTALAPAPGIPELVREMQRTSGPSLEAVLDLVRRVVGEYRFALGTQIVTGAADPLEVAAGYARVAQAAIEVVTSAVIDDFEQSHGRVSNGEFVIVALGRLGGGRLTHASDLDLVYLFTGDFRAESDGRRSLGATQYFNRLAARVSGALSVPTAAGALYEIDTRLRPSGAQGPLVVAVDSFDRYQREAAWTWERMALTRARPVFGSQRARDEVEMIIRRALTRPCDRRVLARDVVAMHADVVRHKPPVGAYDVKLIQGGLVDLEFTVHFHQLASGVGLDPDLRIAIAELTEAGLVESGLLAAHDLLTRLLVTLRLVAPDLAEPVAASRALVAQSCGKSDWPALVASVHAARQCIGRHWDMVQSAEGQQ